MPEYTVRVQFSRFHKETIEADSLEEAQLIAEDIAVMEQLPDEDIDFLDVR